MCENEILIMTHQFGSNLFTQTASVFVQSNKH